jgi:ADP-L-glycero-D-manno-heptose 6-epimerase
MDDPPAGQEGIRMIAITGAAGFLGSNLAYRLAAMGHRLLLVDRPLTAAKVANWAGLGRYEFVAQDLFPYLLRSDPPPIEVIYHLGACSDTTETDWEYLRRNNIEYTQRLWEWCANARRPFYYASSAATYGNGQRGFDDRTPPEKLEPLNLYGKSKNDFDAWALHEVAVGRPQPPGWAGLKFFNVFGPREIHKANMSSVVWKARAQILASGEVRLFQSNDPAYPDGGQTRDFVFVEDCLDHMLWLRQHTAVRGLFNSGTGTPRTFRDLVEAVFSAMGREPRIQYIPMPEDLSRQYQNFTKADMSKLRNAGYPAPPTTLEDGVRRCIAFADAESNTNSGSSSTPAHTNS